MWLFSYEVTFYIIITVKYFVLDKGRLMKKSILCLLIAAFLSGCGGGDTGTEKTNIDNGSQDGKVDSKPNDENGTGSDNIDKYTCLSGVSIPNELVGNWEREFERNGSIGKQIISVLPNCEFDSVEIGDSRFMEEWYTPLDLNRVYKFKSIPLLKITDINDKEFYLDDSTGVGEITDYNTGENVVTWDLPSEGGYFGYKINNSSLTLTYTYSSNYIFTYSYTKIKP